MPRQRYILSFGTILELRDLSHISRTLEVTSLLNIYIQRSCSSDCAPAICSLIRLLIKEYGMDLPGSSTSLCIRCREERTEVESHVQGPNLEQVNLNAIIKVPTALRCPIPSLNVLYSVFESRFIRKIEDQ